MNIRQIYFYRKHYPIGSLIKYYVILLIAYSTSTGYICSAIALSLSFIFYYYLLYFLERDVP